MISTSFIEALADAHSDGIIDLNTLRATCLSAIAAGGGSVSFITTAGLNGKTAQQECNMPADQLLTAVNAALRIVNGTHVGITYVDFSQMPNR